MAIFYDIHYPFKILVGHLGSSPPTTLAPGVISKTGCIGIGFSPRRRLYEPEARWGVI
jgi:hypothetical protein